MIWLEKLMSSPLAWGFLSLIAILGFGFSIITHVKNKEKREFSYNKYSYALIRKSKRLYEKLSITYGDKPIEDLCNSTVTIWNSGNRTLNETDMVDTKEITFKTEGDSIILDAKIVARTEETNKFSIRIIDDHTAKLLFDYADKKDGVVVQIIHTGTEDDLHIDCKIKGGKPLNLPTNNAFPRHFNNVIRSRAFLKTATIVMIVLPIVLILMSIISTVAIFNPNLQTILYATEEVANPECAAAISVAVMFWLISIFFCPICIFCLRIVYDWGVPKALR